MLRDTGLCQTIFCAQGHRVVSDHLCLGTQSGVRQCLVCSGAQDGVRQCHMCPGTQGCVRQHWCSGTQGCVRPSSVLKDAGICVRPSSVLRDTGLCLKTTSSVFRDTGWCEAIDTVCLDINVIVLMGQ